MENYLKNKLRRRICDWLNRGSGSKGILSLPDYGAAVGTTTGLTRKTNEDRAAIFEFVPKNSKKPEFISAVLCDGVGGLKDGGYCAALTISVFIVSLLFDSEQDYKKKMSRAVTRSNDYLYKKYGGHGGTTLSAVIVYNGNNFSGINVGDSRIFKKDFESIEQVSTDDTLDGKLREMNKKSPLLSPEHKHLLQFIGMGNELEPNFLDIKTDSNDDSIIITSDGAHDIGDDHFKSLLRHAEDSNKAASRILKVADWIGGKDNATIIILPCFGLNKWSYTASEDNYVNIWDSFGQLTLWEDIGHLLNLDQLYKKAIEGALPHKENNAEKKVAKKRSPRKRSPKKKKAPPKVEDKNEKDEVRLNIEFKNGDS